MQGTAFKLGQLLAAADIVHAGYCADVRGGAVPPALLGNQVFAMAQGGTCQSTGHSLPAMEALRRLGQER